MTPKNRNCKHCGRTFITPRKLRDHLNKKFPCRPQNPEPEILPDIIHNPEPEILPEQISNQETDPEIEYLNTLGLFDPPEIEETIPSAEEERAYLEALGILEPIPQFQQTDTISSG